MSHPLRESLHHINKTLEHEGATTFFSLPQAMEEVEKIWSTDDEQQLRHLRERDGDSKREIYAIAGMFI